MNSQSLFLRPDSGLVKRLNKEKRPAIPVAVKREVLARATDEQGIPRCEIDGCNNIGKDYDHYYSPWEICRAHEAWNIKLLCKEHHKEKTPSDTAKVHKALRLCGDRVSTRCKKKIPSRPWGQGRPLGSRPKKKSKK